MSTVTPVALTTTDGRILSANLFEAKGLEQKTLVMAGATAVPQGFYRAFAEYMQENGVSVLTFDYRDIGLSRSGSGLRSLKGSRTSFLEWGASDMQAAVDWALKRSPGGVYVVGHSFGLHGFGMLKNANETRGIYAFAGGAGWAGHMTARERVRVWLMWNVLGPVLTKTFGYLPSRLLGIGEDLPLPVYRQWKQWCKNPRYFHDDPSFIYRSRFDAVTVHVRTINTVDDSWAPPNSAEAFLSGYPNAKKQRVAIDSLKEGKGPVGHMGYFRRKHGSWLWPPVLAWVRDDLNA
jgi:predicted alpha/beta hydrolase